MLGSKTLAWGFAIAPHRLRVLFFNEIVIYLLIKLETAHEILVLIALSSKIGKCEPAQMQDTESG